MNNLLEYLCDEIDNELAHHSTVACLGGWYSRIDKIVVIALDDSYMPSEAIKSKLAQKLNLRVDACENTFILRGMK